MEKKLSQVVAYRKTRVPLSVTSPVCLDTTKDLLDASALPFKSTGSNRYTSGVMYLEPKAQQMISQLQTSALQVKRLMKSFKGRHETQARGIRNFVPGRETTRPGVNTCP